MKQPNTKKTSNLQDYSYWQLISQILNISSKSERATHLQKIFVNYGTANFKDYTCPQKLCSETALNLQESKKLVACFELGKRLFSDYNSQNDLPVMRTPADVFEHFQNMNTLLREQVRAVYLNIKNRIVYEETIAYGCANHSSFLPIDVIRPAILYGAIGIIVVHNHPTGDINPSEDDIQATQKLDKSTEIIGLELIDHVIIGKNKYYSFRNNGFL